MADNEWFTDNGYVPFQNPVPEPEPVVEDVPAPFGDVPAPVVEEETVTVEDAAEPVDDAADAGEEPAKKTRRSRSGGDRHRKPRASRSRNGRGGIDADTVRRVRELIAKVDNADDRTRNVVKFLLKDNREGDDALIAALADSQSAQKIAKAVDAELALLDCTDLKAGVVLGNENRAERRYHWDLAATVAPEEAEIIGGGSIDMPVSNDVADEAINIRELQHNIAGYRELLEDVKNFVK